MFYFFSCDLIKTNARIFIIFYVTSFGKPTIFGKPTTSFINKVGFWIVPNLELCNCYDELILRWVFLWVRYLCTSSCQFRVSVLMYFLYRKILMSVNFVSSTDKSCNRSETLSRSIQILAKLSTCTSHRSENFPDLLTIINRYKKALK